MKKEILLVCILAMVCMLAGSVSALSCYQETATDTQACGQSSPGSYDNPTPNVWAEWGGPNEASHYSWTIDGDWGTPAQSGHEWGWAYGLVNYTKPLGATTNSAWLAKYSQGTQNFSIPSSCWQMGTTLSLRYGACYSDICRSIELACLDNTGWQVILQTPDTGDWFFEEAMQWDICEPNWSCSGYAECVDSEQACNAVEDLNNCGIEYTGNFSEFIPQACQMSEESSSGHTRYIVDENGNVIGVQSGNQVVTVPQKQGSFLSLTGGQGFDLWGWLKGLWASLFGGN